MPARLDAARMARELATAIGQEVALARTNIGLTHTAAARLAGVAPATQRRVEAGDPTVAIGTVCRVAAALGLKVWGKAFPVATPSLRDTGQLAIADQLRAAAGTAFRTSVEYALGGTRAIDVVFFGTVEIVCIEIERILTDLQAQYRAADAKRTDLAASHR
jgi:transcriptional regulator with XRE-family HTH domain